MSTEEAATSTGCITSSRKKQDGRPIDAHYGEFNRLEKELRQILKQMQNQWNRLIVLTYLGTLNPVYSSAGTQIMRSFVVSSLEETSLLEDCHS